MTYYASYYYASGFLDPRALKFLMLAWLVVALLSGALFGVAGAWARGSREWFRVAGAALIAGALLGEVAFTIPDLIVREGGDFVVAPDARVASVADYVLVKDSRRYVMTIQSLVALSLPIAALRCWRERALGLAAVVGLAALGMAVQSLLTQMLRELIGA